MKNMREIYESLTNDNKIHREKDDYFLYLNNMDGHLFIRVKSYRSIGYAYKEMFSSPGDWEVYVEPEGEPKLKERERVYAYWERSDFANTSGVFGTRQLIFLEQKILIAGQLIGKITRAEEYDIIPQESVEVVNVKNVSSARFILKDQCPRCLSTNTSVAIPETGDIFCKDCSHSWSFTEVKMVDSEDGKKV